jgi:uncharacterized protein
MTPDVNVLVAASRSDHPHHPVARQWLLEALAQSSPQQPLRLLPIVVAGFLRLVTNARVFIRPTPIVDAVAFLDAFMTAPNVESVNEKLDWPAFRSLCLSNDLVGNAIPDPWIAASVTQINEHLVTFDKGFKKLLTRSQLTVLKG